MPDTSAQTFDWKQFARHSFLSLWGKKTQSTNKQQLHCSCSLSLAEQWTITNLHHESVYFKEPHNDTKNTIDRQYAEWGQLVSAIASDTSDSFNDSYS